MSIGAQALRLAGFLSEQQFRSGEAIATVLGCSRTAVWKQVEQLRALGIAVTAVPGQGYRLEQPLELLDGKRIRAVMGKPALARLAGLRVLADIDSTNSALLHVPPSERHGHALLAELQSGGRGRHGRRWHSPFGRNVYLSLGWRFEEGLAEMSCLPLVVALAASHALDRAGLAGHGIKWPNDLVRDGAKLGGCLVEVQGDPQGPCHAVLGVGLNVHMRGAPGVQRIDRQWTDLGSLLPGVSRNVVAGLLLDELLVQLAAFAGQGFEPFREAWQERDVLAGRTVTVQQAQVAVRGLARGIGPRGGLLLETRGVTTEHLAGEASLGALA